MKKLFEWTMAMILSLSFGMCLASCSQDLDYKKACAEKDWPKAYAIVDKLEAEANPYYVEWKKANGTRHSWAIEAQEKYYASMRKYEEAKRYVVLQEAMSELEQGNLMRIAAIVKEQDATWVYKELIEICESIGDDDLTQKIKRMAAPNDSISE